MHEFETIGYRHMLLNARRLDHLNLIVLAIEDVTERDASYRRQRVLASEMSHRVKNILALVDSIAAQTARKSDSLDDFQKAFAGRLAALARSHGQWLADELQVANCAAFWRTWRRMPVSIGSVSTSKGRLSW
jgi:light-regulated signal transduction histidine kinase (bacteriophytochrome)